MTVNKPLVCLFVVFSGHSLPVPRHSGEGGGAMPGEAEEPGGPTPDGGGLLGGDLHGDGQDDEGNSRVPGLVPVQGDSPAHH